MFFEEEIQVLNCLGLTCSQAKTYLAIGDKNFSTARKIQNKSEIPRQEIYRLLSELEELGLVEKTMDRPSKYKAISINNGISFLLRKRKQETIQIQKITEKIIKKHQNQNNDKIVDDVEPQFILISKKEASIIKRREEINNAQNTIEFISSWKRFPLTVSTFGDDAIKALKRDVKMRVILEKPEDLNQMPDLVKELFEFSNYELRFINTIPSAVIGIFDNKRVLLKTSSSVQLAEKPSLWTCNMCLVSVLSEYFEYIWSNVDQTTLKDAVFL
jgi:sugar-specific transcriptional regulator TrmB